MEDKTYRTVLNSDTGLTTVVCNLCEARAIAGAKFTHDPNCAEFTAKRSPRRFTEITRTITFKIAAEVMPDGTVVIP